MTVVLVVILLDILILQNCGDDDTFNADDTDGDDATRCGDKMDGGSGTTDNADGRRCIDDDAPDDALVDCC